MSLELLKVISMICAIYSGSVTNADAKQSLCQQEMIACVSKKMQSRASSKEGDSLALCIELKK